MTTSEHIKDIATALAKAQGEMEPALKDATNPAFRSKYADLAAVWAACCPALTKNGIATVQDARLDERGVAVTTRLLHSSGQWMEFGPLTVPMAKQDAHGVGSATTYARRYALSAALGIVADDDDGNAASQARAPQQKAQPVVAPAGYNDWLDDLTATADEGSDALKAAWTKSKPEFRQHLTATNNAAWENMKKGAAARVAVTA